MSSPISGPHTWSFATTPKYNGGHLQFFVNCDDYLPMDAVSPALQEVVGTDAKRNFDDGLATWTSLNGESPSTLGNYAELARKDPFKRHDEFFYRTIPEIDELLPYMTERKLLI